jgi:hypothetical protein
MNRTIVKITCGVALTTLIYGCGGLDTDENYVSEQISRETGIPITKYVHVLGDSFWDYGPSPMQREGSRQGRTLQELTALTGKIYQDHSRTNAQLDHILGKQMDELHQDQPNDQIITLLANSGANDVKVVCKNKHPDNPEINPFTPECVEALEKATADRAIVFEKLLGPNSELTTLKHVVWLSLISHPLTMVDPRVARAFDSGARELCESAAYSSRCLFVDVWQLWTPEEALTGDQNASYVLDDQMHVNDRGATLVANEIYQALIANDITH